MTKHSPHLEPSEEEWKYLRWGPVPGGHQSKGPKLSRRQSDTDTEGLRMAHVFEQPFLGIKATGQLSWLDRKFAAALSAMQQK